MSGSAGDVLGTLHVSGAVLSLAELDAPFAVTSGTTDSGVFHAVLDGEAWAIVDDREPIRLAPGKAAFLPGGAAHLIASDPAVEPTKALFEARARAHVG